ncbi:hypothetical protein SynBIOSU31_00990 [Synechococcus sp. BIOS-U3-1]|nr:hypothetical protein SynBIOSU31_00990 [Synechococcus sp. BIOS-U3-1]
MMGCFALRNQSVFLPPFTIESLFLNSHIFFIFNLICFGGLDALIAFCFAR